MTLTATPNDGLTFVAWGGGCGTGTSPTATVTMGTSDLACTATFSGGPPEPLAVTKTGAGSGTVTSAPAGVSCGSTCAADFAQGTEVALTATPATGSRFAGWSGDCSTGGAVTMSAARACTATFVRETCTCDYEWLDPLLIPLDGHPVRLTSVAGGVRFDVNGDGVLDRVAWTVAGARVGFLVLDRNGNGVIDSLDELFGQAVVSFR